MTGICALTVAEFESYNPRAAELIEEYADECALAGLPRPQHNIELYRAMEANNALHVWGASVDALLVGFATLLHVPNPHYGINIPVVETLFISKDFRKGTGLGLRMLGMMKLKAVELGAPGMLLTAPVGSHLVGILSHSSEFKETNRTFFWQAP